MTMEKPLPKRKSIRLKDFNYNSRGAYFITICTNQRRKILSRIVGGDVLDAPFRDVLDAPFRDVLDAPSVKGDVLDAPPHIELLPHGKIADKYINQLNDFYNDIKIDKYVIMPNHIHLIIFVLDNGASRTSPPTKQHSSVSRFVSTFKRFCNRECGYNIWQRYYNDHVIRNQKDYENHLKYIYENPIRWHYDELYTGEGET